MPRLWTCVALGAYLLARASAQVTDDVVTSAEYYYDYDEVDEPPEPARAPTPSPLSPLEPPVTPPAPNPPSPPAGPRPPVVTPPESPSPPATRTEPASPPPPPETPTRTPRPTTEPDQVLEYPPERLASVDDATYRPGDWLIGRSTYFDAPVAWKAKFEPHLFGDVHGNGCGSFTNKGPGLESNSNFTLPLDAVAAVADFDPRFYEGACGSCYELGCITGPILRVATRTNQTKLPLWRMADGRSFYDVDPNASDSFNRTVPGENVLIDPSDGVSEWEYTRCWNESRTIYVTIVDVCPCQYSWGEQTICCGPVPHFDLSYWAHELLAHPLQGKMMLRFRPVHCDTKEPVDARKGATARMGVAEFEENGSNRLNMLNGGGESQRIFVKNASSSSAAPRVVPVYRDEISPGWSFSAYRDQWATISKRGHGEGGSAALCVSVSPGGRMALRCTRCEDTVRPFAGAEAIALWVRSTCATEPRHEPPVYLGVSTMGVYDYALGSTPAERACGNKTAVWDHVVSDRRDNCGWRISVPVSALRGCSPDKANSANALFLELGRGAVGDAKVCMDEASIVT